MLRPERLNDAFPTWFSGGGIFSALQDLTPGVPWKTLNIAAQLDLEYHGNVSGQKIVSPLIRSIQSGEALTPQEAASLAGIIETLNRVNWTKEYETLSVQYAPIENYDMTEVMTNDQTATQFGHTNTMTNNLSHTKTGTEQQTPNTTETRTDDLEQVTDSTETQTPNTTETRTDDLEQTTDSTETGTPATTSTTTPNTTTATDVFGFNSSTAVPAGTQTMTGSTTTTLSGTDTKDVDATVTNSGTVTTRRTGTDTKDVDSTVSNSGTVTTARTGTDTMTYNTTDADTGMQTNAESGTNTTTRNYRLTRSGNIGVTTSQQMLAQERDAWIWNFFREIVFPAVDRVLTIPIY